MTFGERRRMQAPSFTKNPHNNDLYSAYNKPEAVIDWLAHNEVAEEFVLILDADMIMRQPFIPEDMGCAQLLLTGPPFLG